MRIALLEADVNLSVAKDFVNAIKERAVGADVLQSLTPGAVGHQDRARRTRRTAGRRGSAAAVLRCAADGHHARRSARLRQNDAGRQARATAQRTGPALAARRRRRLPSGRDRPAQDARQADRPAGVRPRHAAIRSKIARDGVAEARRLGISTVIIDTAGRLQIDEELMDELVAIKAAVKPIEILFVADAMTGQEATNVAQGLQRPPRHHRRHPHQDGRRRARRRGALDPQRSPARRSSSSASARSSARSNRSIPTASPRASSGWATCSR